MFYLCFLLTIPNVPTFNDHLMIIKHLLEHLGMHAQTYAHRKRPRVPEKKRAREQVASRSLLK